MTLRVLIADDQALMRAGFRMILEVEPDLEIVGEAANGREAVAEAGRLRPDVVLMDVRMPEMDGIEATRRLLHGNNDTKVVMMTTFDMDEYVYEALRAGASGFLLKDVPPEQLVAGIRSVAAGDTLLAPSVTRRLIQEFVRRPPDTLRSSAPELARLTAVEVEVLQMMARWPVQHRDRYRLLRQRDNSKDSRGARAGQARGARPRAGGGVRLRGGHGTARRFGLTRRRPSPNARPRIPRPGCPSTPDRAHRSASDWSRGPTHRAHRAGDMYAANTLLDTSVGRCPYGVALEHYSSVRMSPGCCSMGSATRMSA